MYHRRATVEGMAHENRPEELEITDRIRRHLEAVTASSGLPDTPDSLARITENWTAKRRLFGEQIDALSMESVSSYSAVDTGGLLLLTYSGSLLILGPADEGGRSLEYASISLRSDVPDLVTASGVSLESDVAVDQIVTLSNSPVERSSEILQIATFPHGVSKADQNERLRQAAIFLTNGFVKANQTTLEDDVQLDHFTLRSMIHYIAARNGATQSLTRSIVDDFLTMVESGMLLGERVSLGSLGKASLSVRAAQKPRMGRNPGTGQEILIPAKPEAAVPRFGFSSRVKDRATRVPVERVTGESKGA